MTPTPHRPRFNDFVPWTAQAPCVPVYRQLTGDGLTPVSAFGRIERSAPSFLFESVIGGEKVGRFSFLGTEPILTFEARGSEVVVADPRAPQAARRFHIARPVPRPRGAARADTGPFTCRACRGSRAGLSAMRLMTPSGTPSTSPPRPPTTAASPTSSFAFYDRMLLFDHIRKTILVVAHAHVGPGADPRVAYDQACARVDELVARLGDPTPELGLSDIDTDEPVSVAAAVEFYPGRI